MSALHLPPGRPAKDRPPADIPLDLLAGPPADLVAPRDRRALADVTDRLHQRHPSVSPTHIEALVVAAYRRTDGARVDHYRVVLAERGARRLLDELHAVAPGGGLAPAGR